jgi:uncharacterized protein YlxW (UPF0749 family)
MRDPFIMVVLIVLIVTVGNIFRTRYGRDHRRRRGGGDGEVAERENSQLRDEVKQLKERIAVLERITVEKENSLERQIEALRDR